MSQQTPKRTFKKRSKYSSKQQKKILAWDCCDHGGHHGKSSHTRTAGGRDINTYIVKPDLYLEPTQRTLELSSEDYVPYLDNTNNLLDEITSIINTSPTNRGIITQKTTLSLGGGMFLKPKKKRLSIETETELNDLQVENLIDYIDKVNPEGESLEDIAFKVFFDYWTYGNAFVELIKVDVGGERRLVQRHVPLEMCRPRKAGADRQVTHIGILSLIHI